MEKLAKIHFDHIVKMIASRDTGLREVKAYCLGAGFETDNYSSPVHISADGKIALRYRGVNSYFNKYN